MKKSYLYTMLLLLSFGVLAEENKTINGDDSATHQSTSTIEKHECKQPEIDNSPQKMYPSKALRARKAGAVVLQYEINTLGNAVNIEVLGANPEKFFEQSSIDHMKALHFKIDNIWKKNCSGKKFKHVYYYVSNAECPAPVEGGIPAICTQGMVMKIKK